MWYPIEGGIGPLVADAVASLRSTSSWWDGEGEYPEFNGRRIPKFIEDKLGIFGEDVGLTRLEVWVELQNWIPSLPAEASYTQWESLLPKVQAVFRPQAQSRAIRTLERRVAEEYGLEDAYVLEFVLSSVATVSMPGDPVWGFVVGAPSALKTEVLRWLNGLPGVETLSRLTPHSLISGLKGGASLLPLLDGKSLVIKDFTTIIEMDRKARDEIFAQLRDSFDGYYEGHFGSVGKLSFTSHFHVLAAVTSAIEEYYSIQSSLGQRFLKVRVPPLDAFDRCLEHGGREDELRKEFGGHVDAALQRIEPEAWKSVRFNRAKELRPIVEMLTRGRTHVSRYDGNISMVPEPELAPRVTKQLKKLAIGRALIYGRKEVDSSDLDFLRRVAFDTLPLNRGLVLRALSYPKTVAQLAYFVRLPEATIYRHVEELEALDLVASDGNRPATFRRVGPAEVLNTPHFSEKRSAGPILKEVGGDPADRPAEPGSWTEPALNGHGTAQGNRGNPECPT